jgi:phosphatidate cytidylyltransferase
VTAPDHRQGGKGGQVASGQSGARNLSLRVASSVVLAPIVLLCAYVGGWPFTALCAAGAGGILWEWTSLVAGAADARILVPGLAALLAAMVCAGLDHPGAAVGAVAVGALIAGAARGAGVNRLAGAAPFKDGLWATGGVLYAGAAFCGPALIRHDAAWGFTALLFLFATVWMTDIFAFFAGRAIGGPRLWRSVSPNKTWAGVIGGLGGGLVGAVAVAYANSIGALAQAAVMGLVVSVLAQAGDLFESAVKRHFGAKDTGHLIPGHGGLMDRLDGFLVAALAALLIGVLRQGPDAPARGFLLW